MIVHGIDIPFQADLVYMIMHTKENDKFKYMLTCIQIHTEGRMPEKLQADCGDF